MKKGEYKLKKQIFRNLCRFLVFILMFSCFFVFGKKVSANENQNAAPIITYYRLNGNDITIQWKAPDGVSYSKVDIYSATSPNGSYHYENTVSGNSYTNTYVIKGVPYYYKLEASYEDNDGYYTSKIAFLLLLLWLRSVKWTNSCTRTTFYTSVCIYNVFVIS